VHCSKSVPDIGFYSSGDSASALIERRTVVAAVKTASRLTVAFGPADVAAHRGKVPGTPG
jgi:hypothetical protein